MSPLGFRDHLTAESEISHWSFYCNTQYIWRPDYVALIDSEWLQDRVW